MEARSCLLSFFAFFSTKSMHSLFYELESAFGTMTPQRFKFAALDSILRNEEFFDLINDLGIKLGNSFRFSVYMGVSGDRY